MKTSEVKAMKLLTFNQTRLPIRFAPYLSRSTGQSALALWLDRQRQRLHLSQLDTRLLADIGVSRIAAANEARRWD